MNWPKNVFFGNFQFAEGQEYKQFRFRFACMLLLFSAAITLLLLLLVQLHYVTFDPLYLHIYRAYFLLCLAHYLLLRNRPERLLPLSISYLCIFLLQQSATLLLNTPDELRIIWLALNLPGVYLILGARAGIASMLASMALILAINTHLRQPYSLNALFTFFIGLIYLSAFFYLFLNKSLSFHRAMAAANRRLAHQATIDPLTGVMNPRGYYAETEKWISSQLPLHTAFSVLFVDLDHFKRINDTYGHEAGDHVLAEVAACIAANTRSTDLIGRIGGEEFSILLPQCELDDALLTAEKIRLAIEQRMPCVHGLPLQITASIGVASSRSGCHALSALQHLADQAMYTAKQQGRNRVAQIV